MSPIEISNRTNLVSPSPSYRSHLRQKGPLAAFIVGALTSSGLLISEALKNNSEGIIINATVLGACLFGITLTLLFKKTLSNGLSTTSISHSPANDITELPSASSISERLSNSFDSLEKEISKCLSLQTPSRLDFEHPDFQLFKEDLKEIIKQRLLKSKLGRAVDPTTQEVLLNDCCKLFTLFSGEISTNFVAHASRLITSKLTTTINYLSEIKKKYSCGQRRYCYFFWT